PCARSRRVHTVEEILASPPVHGPLTELQCSPASDGAAAAVLMSEAAVRRHGLADHAVEIAGQAVVTDLPSTFEPRSAIALVGTEMAREAARRAYEHSGLGPEDIQVIELHDRFSTGEILAYEALGLCPEGQGGKLVEEGATTYGGQWVVNPSGGLIARGHPLGATGLAQCAELCWQLRGIAENRQVPGVTAALQHNLAPGGAVVVTVYRNATL
ncbi:MAG TPA: lipid-transfer protein, partial [Frankiaceae bacterium]|nr:lipid-transfer protein [Frankiaceae bacterium]